jgi:hypothetical protein
MTYIISQKRSKRCSEDRRKIKEKKAARIKPGSGRHLHKRKNRGSLGRKKEEEGRYRWVYDSNKEKQDNLRGKGGQESLRKKIGKLYCKIKGRNNRVPRRRREEQNS